MTDVVLTELLRVQHRSRTSTYLLLSIEACLSSATVTGRKTERSATAHALLLDRHNVAVAYSEKATSKKYKCFLAFTHDGSA